MTPLRRLIFVLTFIAASASASAPGPAAAEELRLPERWRAWTFAWPVEVEAGAAMELVRVPLDFRVLIGSEPGLTDLRVIDGAGLEVPYLVHVRAGKSSREWRPTEMTDPGFVEGRYTEAIVEIGGEEPRHNAVELRTGEDDFFVWVSVATSEDRGIWKVLLERAPAYRFRSEGVEGNLEVTYPESRARWLRLRILDPDKAFPLEDVRVAYEVREPTVRIPVAQRLQRGEDREGGRTVWTVDLEGAAPISGVQFRSDAAEFHRPVVVHSSDDGEAWARSGQGDIFRRESAGETGGVLERLEVELPDRWARFWLVEVLDRDDRPVDGLMPELQFTERDLVFRPTGRGRYLVLHGNPQAKPASYDLARVTTREEIEAAAPLALGPRSRNAGYVSAAPWTEQHPVVLWAALGLAVAVLFLLALRTLR
jgi:hypothetical protein